MTNQVQAKPVFLRPYLVKALWGRVACRFTPDYNAFSFGYTILLTAGLVMGRWSGPDRAGPGRADHKIVMGRAWPSILKNVVGRVGPGRELKH